MVYDKIKVIFHVKRVIYEMVTEDVLSQGSLIFWINDSSVKLDDALKKDEGTSKYRTFSLIDGFADFLSHVYLLFLLWLWNVKVALLHWLVYLVRHYQQNLVKVK